MKGMLASAWGLADRTGYKIVNFILGLIGKKLSDEQWAALMQFVKFGLVGLMNTFVDIGVYWIALWLFTALNWFGDKAYMVATYLGFVVSFFNMFYWNNKYVFKEKEGETRSVWLSLIKLFLSYSITGVVIKPLCMFLLVDGLGFPEALAPIPIMLITIPLNFLLSKLWAFRGKKTEQKGG